MEKLLLLIVRGVDTNLIGELIQPEREFVKGKDE